MPDTKGNDDVKSPLADPERMAMWSFLLSLAGLVVSGAVLFDNVAVTLAVKVVAAVAFMMYLRRNRRD